MTAEAAVAALSSASDGQMVLSLFHLECSPDGCQHILASAAPFLPGTSIDIYIFFGTRGPFLLASPESHRPWCVAAEGCSISPPPPAPEGQPATREKETSIESWMRGSHPAMPAPWKEKNTGIYPRLTLLRLMQFPVPNLPAATFSAASCFMHSPHILKYCTNPPGGTLTQLYAPMQMKVLCDDF